MSKAEASYEQWRELEKAINRLLGDALYLAGHRHGLSHYAEIPEGDSALCISREAFFEEAQGCLELLDDMRDDISETRKKLKEYVRANK